MNKLRIALLVIIFAGAAAYLYLERSDAPLETPTASASYISGEFGYSLSYPADLTYREYAGGDVVFGREEGESMNAVAEVRILTVAGAPGQSFIDTVGAELATLCAADGPDTSFSCTGVEEVGPFTTASGLSGNLLYLAGSLTILATGEVTSVRKGPYFIIPLSTGATASRVLVVHAPLTQSAEMADAATIRAIAESVSCTQGVAVSSESVEAYVRQNISELSPEKEVLGGTFYVTAVEAAGGKGTVSYEDGHNAYTADFTYETDAEGNPRVLSFTVRN
jgi:hypothetical protein